MRSPHLIWASALLATVMALVQRWTALAVIDAVTIGLLAEIVLLLINDAVVREKPAQKVKAIYGEPDIVNMVRTMRNKAKHRIHSIWCSMDWTPDLEAYFLEFKGIMDKKKIPVLRLINLEKAGNAVVQHLSEFREEIKTGKYIVASTPHTAFEFMVVDNKEALLLLPHAVRPEIALGIYSEDESFVNALVHLFITLWHKENELSVPIESSEDQITSSFHAWIQTHASRERA